MNGREASDSVQKYLHDSGYTQKQLASELGLHPKVLSRKLNGNGNAYLTHLEVRRMLTTLVDWRAITTQDQALHLLEMMQVEPTIFSAEEWQQPPLGTLERKSSRSVSSNMASLPAQTHNVPAPTTRLIGREWAVARLCEMLGRDDVRLVTLVGCGGSGKTSLALQVANELVGTFAQGVWFVPLAGIHDATLVPVSIMQAMNIQSAPGVPPLQGLIAYLHNKQLLLVLDNFEHVSEATTVVDTLLAGVAGLKVLVTSRAILRLYGERKFSVPPLDMPDLESELKPADLAHFAAVQLFVERAQAVQPDFAFNDGNAAIIAQICARVDGLPLALELAAARIRVLPPAQLLERLTQAPLEVLTGGARNLPGRLQTLRNTITWSYNLLSATEQTWFRRLGICNGGWSLEAAEAMMRDLAEGEEGSALDILEQLVDNSLVVPVPGTDGQARFTMLETLREYAQERLIAEGECEHVRDWHACYYLKEAEAAELGLRGPQQLTWLARLKQDRDNLRSALEWLLQRARAGKRTGFYSDKDRGEGNREVAGSTILSLKGEPCAGSLASELALRLASALRASWEWQGYLTEARYWLKAALEVPVEDTLEETVLAARAKALSESSRLFCLQNDQSQAIAQAEEGIALWRRLGDPRGLAAALLQRGWTAHVLAEYQAAKSFYEEGLQQLSQAEDIWLRGQLLLYIGDAVGFMGEYDQMRSFHAQSRKLFEQLGDTSAVADLLKDQGGITIIEGNYAEAITSLVRSLRLCYKLDHRQYITTGICMLSLAVGMSERPDPVQSSLYSAQLKGAADALMKSTGFTTWADDSPLIQIVEQYIRSRVDDQSWEAAWAAGRALTIQQAIELACKLGEGVQQQ